VSTEAPVRLTRFGAGTLADLGEVLAEAGIGRAMLVATRRGASAVGGLPVVGVYDGVRPHVPAETVDEAAALAVELGADGLVGLGGGSAIDTCKAVVAEVSSSAPDASVLRIVAVPTTYAGAEWTPYFGVLLGPGRKGGGMDARAVPVAAVYDPELTLELPLEATVGTSMNALAHCAEAYYHPEAQCRAARHADTGATAIGHALPLVVSSPRGTYGRARLLEGAMRAALALAESGLCLAHAMAQALGGRYGLPQGSANAVCLPPALRFNAEAVPEAVARFAAALGVEDAPRRVEELARLGGFERLRDLGVPEDELDEVAEAIVARRGAKANPRPATADDIAGLLRSIW
jgi:alcohol dehydrogenase class IV